MKKLWMLLLLLPALAGCDSSKVFQRFEDIPNNKWSREQPVTFEVNIEDASVNYNVDLAIRHTTYYLWADLMVNLTSTYPSGEERTKDFDFFLKESDGSFKGEGAGDLWDITFPMMENIKFPESGTYKFKVSNIMPIPETDDIMQVGLVVKKAE
jgi:gliding motility-associated lipoprotein GldH